MQKTSNIAETMLDAVFLQVFSSKKNILSAKITMVFNITLWYFFQNSTKLKIHINLNLQFLRKAPRQPAYQNAPLWAPKKPIADFRFHCRDIIDLWILPRHHSLPMDKCTLEICMLFQHNFVKMLVLMREVQIWCLKYFSKNFIGVTWLIWPTPC